MDSKSINARSSRQFFFSLDPKKDLTEQFIYVLEGLLQDYRRPVGDPLPVPSRIEFTLIDDNHCFQVIGRCYDPLFEKDARERWPHIFEGN